MGEIVEFPYSRANRRDGRRDGCAHWRRGQEATMLIARPACAALAMAIAADTPRAQAQAGNENGNSMRPAMRASATILTMGAARVAR